MRSIRLTQPDVLLDRILREAVAAGASDVHLEPQASYLRVRFRIDGLLHGVLLKSLMRLRQFLATVYVAKGQHPEVLS